MTDDGVRCALEYNCVRWGSHDLPPQAGIGVYERGPDGLLAAARVYDDIEAPVESSGPGGQPGDQGTGQGLHGRDWRARGEIVAVISRPGVMKPPGLSAGKGAASHGLKLEVVVLPVSDVDKAKDFYQGLGWRLDANIARARTSGWSS